MSFQRPLRTTDRGKVRLQQARQFGWEDGFGSRKQFSAYFVEPTDQDERHTYLAAYRRGQERRAELKKK